MADNKQKIINDIYFDKGGFGSKANTLKDAREKDKTITMQDVEQFFKKNVEIKRKQTRYNSFVAPKNKHTYQVDITYFREQDFEKEQKFYYAFTCIDVLSKFATAVPITNRYADDLIEATKESIKRMGGKSKIIFSDDESGLRTDEYEEFVEGEGIELYRTRTKAFFVERWNRTLKDMIFKRAEADEKKGKQNIQWIDYLDEVLVTYNYKMKHSATGMIPNEARKEKNEFRAMMNVANKARKDRVYPEIEISDKVKIIRNKRTGEKERTSKYLAGEYTVESIAEKLGQKYYTLTGFNRPLLRHDILKI